MDLCSWYLCGPPRDMAQNRDGAAEGPLKDGHGPLGARQRLGAHVTHYGKRLDHEGEAARVVAWRAGLQPEEQLLVVAKIARTFPAVDRIAVTDHRILEALHESVRVDLPVTALRDVTSA